MSEDEPRVVHADFEGGAPDPSSLPGPTVAEVAFAGRSNVGKSSLMNALMQRRNLVRTSSTPGCTRQINIFGARLQDGLSVRLVDLPGYGYAKVSKAESLAWGKRIEEYLVKRPTLRAAVVIVDVRRGVEADDAQLLEFLRTARKEPVVTLLVATKLDKLPRARRKPALEAVRRVAKVPILGVSGWTGEGRSALWTLLRKACGAGGPEVPGGLSTDQSGA